MFSNEYIDHHGQHFVANKLHLHGIRFEHYLRNPKQYKWAETEHLPLLPKQQMIRQRLVADELQ